VHPAVAVEEGAFGKGIGIDDALSALRGSGATGAFLDLGGQTACIGRLACDVDLADPRDRARPVLRLRLDGGSVSTSGNSERGAAPEGRRIGHLLDPRSGRPARDFGSMTVWAGRAALADALSTALFVLGPDEALRWAGARPGVEAVAIETTRRGLRVRSTPGLRGRLVPLVPGIDVEFRARRGEKVQ
jgi:thiamine biosynthesis lipoprotein